MSYTILRRVMALPMSGTQKWVLAVLADFADKDGICFPHVSSIAARAGVSRPTVQRALAWLEERGHIVRELRCAEGKGSVYTITAPALAQERENANDAPPHQIDAPPHQIDAPPASKRCTPSAPPIVEDLTKDLTVQGTSTPPLPPTKPKRAKHEPPPCLPDVQASTYARWLAHRPAIGCRKPWTADAQARHEREAEKAGLSNEAAFEYAIAAQWQAFTANYYFKAEGRQNGTQNGSGYKSAWQRREEEAQKWIKPKPKTQHGVISDITPANREQFTLLEKAQ